MAIWSSACIHTQPQESFYAHANCAAIADQFCGKLPKVAKYPEKQTIRKMDMPARSKPQTKAYRGA
jgi:hypothetical protein